MCGVEREAVKHFLLRCIRWNEQRRMLLEATGLHFDDLPWMLGAKPESVDGTNGVRQRLSLPLHPVPSKRV